MINYIVYDANIEIKIYIASDISKKEQGCQIFAKFVH